MEIPLSRLAREAKVVRVSGIVSGLAAADSVGLLARRHCAARPSRPGIRDSGSRGITPPYSRASATGVHRLPGTESAVNVAENFGIPVWPGRCIPPGERSRGAPEQARTAQQNSTSRPRCARRANARGAVPRGKFDIERRFEDLLEQLPLVHGG